MTMLGLLLFVACLVAIGTRRIGLPYTTGLVVAGLGLGLSGYSGRISLTPDLVFTFLLPPLIFEAALHLGWKQARREAPLVLTLAFVGTFLSATVAALGMHWLAGWGWMASALFGALIGATDPVSVIALMKDQNAAQRLRFIMESESLVNDGAAAVLFSLALALALAVPRSLAEHDALVGVTFAVVAFSIFVQGLTVPVLLRRADAQARA